MVKLNAAQVQKLFDIGYVVFPADGEDMYYVPRESFL